MNTQTLSSSWLGPINNQEVVNQITASLFGSYHNHLSAEAIWSEILRTVIWSLSIQKQPLSLSESAITTKSILTQARAMWTPFNVAMSNDDKEFQLELERYLLDALEEQGDVFSLARGRWLPAPLRLIPLTNTHYLIAGCLPTRLLPNNMHKEIHFHGGFRHIEQKIISQTATLPPYIGSWRTQLLDHWLGSPPPTFAQLIQLFNNLTLQHAASHANDNPSVEVYTPYIDKPQALRWLAVTQVCNGRYLLRTHTPWGTNHYSIGEIQGHALVAQGELAVSTDIRRLCYALDTEAKMPTRAEWDRQHGQLMLRSELPIRERKQLASIATLRTPENGYYPRTWIGITSTQSSIVDKILTELCIRVTN